MNQELFNMQLIISSVLEEDPEYVRKAIYDLKIEYGDAKIEGTQNIFYSNISPQLLCLKLINNITMMGMFTKNFAIINGGSLLNDESKNKTLFLRLFISHENVEIMKKSGFGLFAYNVDDMAFALNNYYYAMEKYLKKLSEEGNYTFLNRILADYKSLYNTHPNDAIIGFINNNKDFFSEYINKAEEIKNQVNRK